ncbi:hypothetical protein ACVII0_002767 [Sinorhizobium meliloti]
MAAGETWIIKYLPLLFAAAAFIVSIIAILRVFSSDRPFMTAIVPFCKSEFPVTGPWACLQFRNDGNFPALITRTVVYPILRYTDDPTTPRHKRLFPAPLAPPLTYESESRGSAHAVGPNQITQRIGFGGVENLIPVCGDDRFDLYVQCMVDYQDIFGRKFRALAQFRYDKDVEGFRLAWPGKPNHPQFKASDEYFSHTTLRGYLMTLLYRLSYPLRVLIAPAPPFPALVLKRQE